jgi:hypothetical protein
LRDVLSPSTMTRPRNFHHDRSSQICAKFPPLRNVMATQTPLQETDILYTPLVPGTTEPLSKATVFTLLNEAFPDASVAQQIYSQKVEHRPLSVAPATQTKDARETRREAQLAKLKRKRKPKPLSAREKRELRVFDVAKDSVRYPQSQHFKRFGGLTTADMPNLKG